MERIIDGAAEALASSAAVGGVFGATAAYIVGGFGIAAMGTAVGVGSAIALPVLTVAGAVFGAVVGGGNHVLLEVLADPGDFRIVWPNLALTFLASVAISVVATEIMRRIALGYLPDID